MKRIINYMFMIFLSTQLISCYDIQGSYDYEPVNSDPNIYMTAWEFIEARQDTFKYFKQAIEHVDATYPGFKDLYTQQERKYTYMFLNERAFTSSKGVFATTGTTSKVVADISPEVLRDILLYHIVDGYYHGLTVEGSVNFDPINVITLWKDPNAIMTLCLDKSSSIANFSRIKANEAAGNSSAYRAATSNLLATNGAIHVFSDQLIYVP